MKFFITLLALTIISVLAVDPDFPKSENIIQCPAVKSQFCTKIYDPVCAWMDPRINCVAKHYPCAKNASNSCTACNIKDVVSFSKGPCPKLHVMYEPEKKEIDILEGLTIHQCNEASKKNRICTMEYNPTCAWLDKKVNCGSAKSPCGKNAGNPCMACGVTDAVKYTMGVCPKEHLYKKENVIEFIDCTEEEKKAEVCPMIFEPKCAWLRDEVDCVSEKKPCGVMASNRCEACRIKDVVKFSHGDCPKDHLASDI